MLSWILEHKEDLLAIYGAVVAICTIVVKLTPSTKDDTIWGKIINILDKFSTAFKASDAAKLSK